MTAHERMELIFIFHKLDEMSSFTKSENCALGLFGLQKPFKTRLVKADPSLAQLCRHAECMVPRYRRWEALLNEEAYMKLNLEKMERKEVKPYKKKVLTFSETEIGKFALKKTIKNE